MDREISKEYKRKRKIRLALTIGAGAVAAGVAVAVALLALAPSVKMSSLEFMTADRGTVEASVDASGRVAPAYEIEITSPVSTRILELYCHEGDLVAPGQSLLRLDVAGEETELEKLADRRMMKSYDSEQARLSSRTYLTNLEMQIEAKEMSVARLATEVANERRLDSIGSGTGDRVREADLAYRTAMLELNQLRTQLANERASHEAAGKSRRLDERILDKNIEQARHTLEDAKVKAPGRATVTFLNSSLGTSIAAGEKLAVLSDLTHFKINCETAEGNADKLALGAEASVRIGRGELKGRVGTVTPKSSNGVMAFTVLLDNDSSSLLRAGMRADISVLHDIAPDVVRIPAGSYYHGPGVYTLYVDTGEGSLEQRQVVLGEGNFDYVEVKSGLRPGERLVRNELPPTLKDKLKIRIK